jgi:hypothetical protein
MPADPTYIGKISGPIWGSAPEAAYDVIVKGVNIRNQANRNMLNDEKGVPVFGAIVPQGSEIEIQCAIKGANNLGKNSLIGSKIAALTNVQTPLTDVAGPFFVVSNEASREEDGWAKCSATVYYGDASFDTQTLPAETTAASTTA